MTSEGTWQPPDLVNVSSLITRVIHINTYIWRIRSQRVIFYLFGYSQDLLSYGKYWHRYVSYPSTWNLLSRSEQASKRFLSPPFFWWYKSFCVLVELQWCKLEIDPERYSLSWFLKTICARCSSSNEWKLNYSTCY